MNDKLPWEGRLTSVQPRIRLNRSFDQRSHGYLGYALRVRGTIGDSDREFLVGIGKAAQAKHEFRAGDIVCGQSQPVLDNRLEAVEFYKTSKLKVIARAKEEHQNPPPWLGVPPILEIYRERGHRRLDARTYDARCQSCLWGCRMAVEMIIDQWNPVQRRYRFETFAMARNPALFIRQIQFAKSPAAKG